VARVHTRLSGCEGTFPPLDSVQAGTARARLSQILDLIFKDDRLNVYAGELEERPPPAPTTTARSGFASRLGRASDDTPWPPGERDRLARSEACRSGYKPWGLTAYGRRQTLANIPANRILTASTLWSCLWLPGHVVAAALFVLLHLLTGSLGHH
jgi:hypothetical protein